MNGLYGEQDLKKTTDQKWLTELIAIPSLGADISKPAFKYLSSLVKKHQQPPSHLSYSYVYFVVALLLFAFIILY